MSNVFSRACALFVVLGGLAACASPSRPSAIPSTADVGSGLTDISPGVTDTTLGNNGWTCKIPPHPNSLRTSRLGLSSEAAHSQ